MRKLLGDRTKDSITYSHNPWVFYLCGTNEREPDIVFTTTPSGKVKSTKIHLIVFPPFRLHTLLAAPLEFRTLFVVVAGSSYTSQSPPSSFNTVTSTDSFALWAGYAAARAPGAGGSFMLLSLSAWGAGWPLTGRASSSPEITGKSSLSWRERRKRSFARRCRW